MTPKFNIDRLKPATVSAILMALIYVEDKFSERVKDLFGLPVHAFTDSLQKYYYAVCLDGERKLAHIVFRGTDGKNTWGRFTSWLLINFRIGINSRGFHKGFWKIALEAAHRISGYLSHVETVYVGGHSQGSGVGTCFLAIIGKVKKEGFLYNIKKLHGNLFCSPPACNDKGKAEIDGYISDGIETIDNYVSPGDKISADFLRKKRGPLAGRDVGNMIDLPDIIPEKYGLLDAVSHSPTLVLYAYKDSVNSEYDEAAIEYVLNNGWVEN